MDKSTALLLGAAALSMGLLLAAFRYAKYLRQKTGVNILAAAPLTIGVAAGISAVMSQSVATKHTKILLLILTVVLLIILMALAIKALGVGQGLLAGLVQIYCAALIVLVFLLILYFTYGEKGKRRRK